MKAYATAILVPVLFTACSAAVSYKTPAGGEARVEWQITVPVVETKGK